MANAEHAERVVDPVPGTRPDLRSVTDLAATDGEHADQVPFETGLIRSCVIGGTIGFVFVVVLVGGGFLLAGIDPVAAIMGALFVGAFAGVGFGGMTGASIHQPPSGRSGPAA